LNVRWKTNARNGYIVQEMLTQQSGSFCDGTPDPGLKPGAPRFWEAWRVQEDGSVHPPPGADLWQMPVDPDHRGSWRLTGKVHFVEQLDPAAGFRVGNEAAGPAGSLYSTTTQPRNLGPVLLTRQAGGRWACCAGESVHVPDTDPDSAGKSEPGTTQSLLTPAGPLATGGATEQGRMAASTASDDVCPPGYTMCDFIDKGISVHGQYALFNLYKRGGSECRDAIQILSAVRSDQVQGVFKADERKPALLAQQNGTGWWALQDHPSSVPNGGSAFVFEGEAPPMVVFRTGIASDHQALATALEEAWKASSIGGSTLAVSPPSMKTCAPAPPADGGCPPGTVPDSAGNCVEKKTDCPPGTVPDASGSCVPEKKPDDCPPGLIPDPTGEFCILPGKIVSPCTDSEMSRAFQSAQDSCAGIRMGIDILCAQGASPCDVIKNEILKNLCKLGGDNPASICDTPRPKYYEDCTVGEVIGSKPSMSCFPGSNQEILEKYKQWPGRITS
jgi:hypothetical protein